MCREIKDEFGVAEAECKLGNVYFALRDNATAAEHWGRAIEFASSPLPTEMSFWRASAAAFLAAFDRDHSRVRDLLDEMTRTAQRTQYIYLILASQMLKVYHLQIQQRYEEALTRAKQIETGAKEADQQLWVSRARIKAYELQEILGYDVVPEDLRSLIQLAQEQPQNDVIHRGFRLLRTLRSDDVGLFKEWLNHWQTFQNEIPEKYHAAFQPV